MRRRVKITGLGPVTPAGIGKDAFFKGINENVSRARRIDRLEKEAGKFVAAEIEEFDLQDWIPKLEHTKRLPRHTQFALAATTLALQDAKCSLPDLADLNPVIVNGSSLMDMKIMQQTFVGVATRGPRHGLPSAIYEAQTSAIAARIAELLQVRCRVLAVQTACCGGLDAVGHGARMVSDGETDIAICCGTEAPLYANPMAELAMVKLSPRNTCEPKEMGKPFDLWRNTGVIGEGACVMVLEPEDSPRPAYAWVGGYAYGGDADGLAASGLAWTMRMALANAAIHPEKVDLIHAWGSGHVELDKAEARCLTQVFGDRVRSIPAVSIKGAIGNSLAAAGAIQIASAALCLSTGLLPPTVNWQTADPECPLNLSANMRETYPTVAIINAHGASGTNASLVISQK